QFLSGVLCFGGLRSLLIYVPRYKKVCWNFIYARRSSSTGKNNDNPAACTNIDFIYVGILIAVDFNTGNSVSECRASHDNGQSHSEQDFHANNLEINAPIVHPKMNSGKESVANAEFGVRSAEYATRPSRFPGVFNLRIWSARTRPRFGSTRHVASRKAATCCRTPKCDVMPLPSNNIRVEHFARNGKDCTRN